MNWPLEHELVISPLTRLAGELCCDCIREVAPNSEPSVTFAPARGGMKSAAFRAKINEQWRTTVVEFRGDDGNVDEGEWEAQVFWFEVNRGLDLGAPDGVPITLRPRRKGPVTIPGKSAKPVMGFLR